MLNLGRQASWLPRRPVFPAPARERPWLIPSAWSAAWPDIAANAPPQRGRPAACLPLQPHPGHQCRGAPRPQPPHPDAAGHDDHPPAQGPPGPPDHRFLRRFEVRPHRAQPDQEPVPPAGHEVCAGLARRTACAGDYIISEILEPNGIEYVSRPAAWKKPCPSLHILYITRVQRERFFNEEDYIRLKNSYVLTKTKLESGPG